MNEVICFDVDEINDLGVVAIYNDSKIFINFSECAKNYARENSFETSKCVALRDITNYMFVFFTNPRTIVKFKKNFLREFIGKKSATSRFMSLQKKIEECGYTSFDMS